MTSKSAVYELILRNKFVAINASSKEEFAQILFEYAKYVQELMAEPSVEYIGGADDDYARFITTNRVIAHKYDFEDISKFYDDEEEDEIFSDNSDKEIENDNNDYEEEDENVIPIQLGTDLCWFFDLSKENPDSTTEVLVLHKNGIDRGIYNNNVWHLANYTKDELHEVKAWAFIPKELEKYYK